MTNVQSRPQTRKLGYVAFGVSLVTAAAMWLTLLSSNTESVFLNIGVIAIGLIIGVIASIVLDVIAGVSGGINRVLAIVGGALLLSPALLVAVGLIRSLFLSPTISHR